MSKTISTRKIQIRVNSDDNQIKKDYYKYLRDLEYNTYKCANQIIQLQFFKDIIKNGLDEGKGNITRPDLKDKVEKYFGTSIRNIGYKFSDNDYKKNLPSYVRGSLNSLVFKNYQSDYGEVLSGKRSIRTYKKGMPIPFMKNVINNLKTSTTNNFEFEFMKIPMMTYLGRDRSDNESIINNIISGKFKMCDSSLQFKDNKLFLLLVFESDKIKNKLDYNKVVGVDMGLNIPLYLGISGEKLRISIGNKESFSDKKIAFQKRRRSLQSNLKLTKGGKGRKKKLKALEKLKSAERNWTKNMNHKYSKEIVDFLIKNNIGVLNIENLKGYDSSELVLRNWTYFELQLLITQKCEKNGIVVNKIDPKYTSQRCSSCGHISNDNRDKSKGYHVFECVSCGHSENADYNASKNISIAHTDKFIEEIKKHVNMLKIEKNKLEKSKKLTLV